MSDCTYRVVEKLYVTRRFPRLVTNAPCRRLMALRVQLRLVTSRAPERKLRPGATEFWCPDRNRRTCHCTFPHRGCFASVLNRHAVCGSVYVPAGTITPG